MPLYERDELHARPSQSRTPRANTTRQTWGNNGFHFTVETTSFSSPGRSFTTPGNFSNGSTRNASVSPQSPPRSAGANMLGAAFNLFGDFVALREQQQEQLAAQEKKFREEEAAQERRHQQRKRSSRQQYDGDRVKDESHRSRHDSRRESLPRGLFAHFAERYAEKLERTRNSQRRDERSPAADTLKERFERSKRSHRRKARASEPWAGRFETRSGEATEDERSDYSKSQPDDSDDHRGSTSCNSSTTDDAAVIEALEEVEKLYQLKIEKGRERIQLASTLPKIDAAMLQILLDEQNTHEAALMAVQRDLEVLKAGSTSRRPRPHHSRHSTFESSSTRSSTQTAPPHPFQGAFGFGDFEAFFGPRRASHQSRGNFGNPYAFSAFGAAPFGGFESFFADPMFGPEPSFGIPRPKFTGRSTTGGFPSSKGTSREFPRRSSTPLSTYAPMYPQPKPQPPPTLLRPQEAKVLFQDYNDRWNALAPTDPNIPYPCRGFQARALNAKDSLWAPDLRSPIATWSDDAVMQANAQAFYLGAADLAPTYTEALGTGTIVRGFDKSRATSAQVQQLIDVLKKEKTRWHSDRLGRRNGGGADAGVNERLQRDERARAVFHTVCELMEFAQ